MHGFFFSRVACEGPSVRMLREELQLLQEPGSYVGEVIKVMGKTKVLIKVRVARATACARVTAARHSPTTTTTTRRGRRARRQVHPEGKYVVDVDKSIAMSSLSANLRVALRNDSYTLHKASVQACARRHTRAAALAAHAADAHLCLPVGKTPLQILPNKVDPLVSLMMVEKVPDSTYDMVGGLDKQIKEIKEVRRVVWSAGRERTR